MPVPSVDEIRAFEADLDAELIRRPAFGCDANGGLHAAADLAELVAMKEPGGPLVSELNSGIEAFAARFVRGDAGSAIDYGLMVEDLLFGAHYQRLRDILYYSYNAPGAIDWTVDGSRIELRFADRSIPRQFFTVWNNHVYCSERLFEDFTGEDKVRTILKGKPEFEEGEYLTEVLDLLAAHADLKLSEYFSIIDPTSEIDLGGYSYRDIYTLYRLLVIKALFHRSQSLANRGGGLVRIEPTVLRDNLSEDSGIDGGIVERILRDLVYDKDAVVGRVDATYFSLMKEGASPGDIIMRPFHFSQTEGLVQLLRVVANRRPNSFLAGASEALGKAFVQRVKASFEAQGFTCHAEFSLRKFDAGLPDIDLLVIAEEPTLGFTMFVCEVKCPLPALWGKDQLRAREKDSVSKAFRQVEAIGGFLRTDAGIEFIRSVVPSGGLQHFDGFVVVLKHLIVTSDNAGMFFSHETTPIVNIRTLQRILECSDGDILYVLHCIAEYNSWADQCFDAALLEVEVNGRRVEYEGVTPRKRLDFAQAIWRSGSERQQMIDDFVADGHHPFDCLVGREDVLVARPKS